MTPSRAIREAKQAFKVRSQWLGEGGQPSPHAQERANTCLTCPKHVLTTWQEFWKSVGADMLKAHLELKGKMNLRVEGEEKLEMCSLCGCVLRLKVHVPLDIARANTPDWEKFPAHCWMHNR